MKISTKGRYALRLMMDLAENNSGSPISLKDVAKRQDISNKYDINKPAVLLCEKCIIIFTMTEKIIT